MAKKTDKEKMDEVFPEEIGTGEGLFSDSLELVGHGLKIHTKGSRVPADYVLFPSDEDDREFVRSLHRIALQTRVFIRDPKVAESTYQMIIAETVCLAALKRNVYQNPIIGGLFRAADEEDTDAGLVDVIKEKVGLGKK